jgi:hypothetical protein
MNKNPTDPTQRTYSPFWPVFAVFLVLVFLQASYVIEDFKQRSQLQAAKTELARTVAQAQTINLTAERVGHELLVLAADKSAEAAKIIADFQIRSNAPPQAPKETKMTNDK